MFRKGLYQPNWTALIICALICIHLGIILSIVAKEKSYLKDITQSIKVIPQAGITQVYLNFNGSEKFITDTDQINAFVRNFKKIRRYKTGTEFWEDWQNFKLVIKTDKKDFTYSLCVSWHQHQEKFQKRNILIRLPNGNNTGGRANFLVNDYIFDSISSLYDASNFK